MECSALVLRELGETIDIHGGGADLIYPHHECETLQSEAATGVDILRSMRDETSDAIEGAVGGDKSQLPPPPPAPED